MITVFANAIAQILLKKGMTGDGAGILSSNAPIATIIASVLTPFVIIGLALYVVAMGSHMIVLSKLDVSVAYPLLSLAYVVVAVYAVLVMNESFTLSRAAGLVLICLGTWLITR
jgi:multidrug transporter EmrE-like cation transporter